MGFEIVCCLALNDIKVYDHIMPVALHPSVEKIRIIRSSVQTYKPIPKAQYIIIPGKCKPIRFLKMLIACYKLGKSKNVKAFISFNPLPYGLISYISNIFNKKKIHFGFIGTDWNIYGKGKTGSFLRYISKKTDFITVIGDRMKKEMLDYGFDEKKISILPHSIDLEHFCITENTNKVYDCIFIGNLIALKNVSDILHAFRKVVDIFPESQLCILGDGALKQELIDETKALNISGNVSFKGFVADPRAFFEKSKMLVLASSSEGFPFVLVEAISSGVVPVTTPVGTIPDVLQDGENALFFEVGNSKELADKIIRLLQDKFLYHKLKENVIYLRNNFAFEKATKIWDNWFKTID